MPGRLDSVSLADIRRGDAFGRLAVRRPIDEGLRVDGAGTMGRRVGSLELVSESTSLLLLKLKLPVMRLRASSTCARVMGTRAIGTPGDSDTDADACKPEGEGGTDCADRDDDVDGR